MTTPQSRQPQLEAKIRQELAKVCCERAVFLMLVWAVGYALLGVSTLPYLRTIYPELTIWQNTWPRLVFNSVPFIMLTWFLKSSKIHDEVKIYITMLGQGVMFTVAAAIYMWPASLHGDPSILLHVNGMNVAYFVGIWTVLCPPRRLVPYCLSIFVATIWFPLFGVAYLSGNPAILSTIVANTVATTMMAVLWTFLGNRTYEELEQLKSKRQDEATQFLGESVSAAIFDGKKELLEETTVSVYVLFIDIRESSRLTNEHGKRWAEFSKEWLTKATETTFRFKGDLIKTGGDSLLVTFGLFEDDVNLDDVPGLEGEVANAKDRRWERLTKDCFGAIDAFFEAFQEVSLKHFPDFNMKIGAGLDRGPVTRGVRGGLGKLEFDIWGDRVNCASRLESYSKVIASEMGADSSVLVISPFATDFLGESEVSLMRRCRTQASPIRDFNGIKWVLAREYRRVTRNFSKSA